MSDIYVASISHGKDSIAMLHVIMDVLHLPLDMIVTADIWFDEETRAELPPMVEWKDKADAIILDRWSIPVTHLCATRGGGKIATHEHSDIVSQNPDTVSGTSKDSPISDMLGARNSKPKKLTYKDIFYRRVSPQREREREGRHGNISIYGYPMPRGSWCQSDLKRSALQDSRIRDAVGVQENSRTLLRLPDYEPRGATGVQNSKHRFAENHIYGFPYKKGNWCQSRLKGKHTQQGFWISPIAQRAKR